MFFKSCLAANHLEFHVLDDHSPKFTLNMFLGNLLSFVCKRSVEAKITIL